MKIGIIVFAYSRSLHLSKVLDALKKNSDVDKLYIFQDGLKREEHREEWEKTQEVINSIDWCEVIYSLSNSNKGLRKSILEGVNLVFQENDAVVVLEDDCVPASNFMIFMKQSLEKYEKCEQVYAVSGYAWPLELEEKEQDAYFCGRISSWGWGTWRDRWNKLEIDYEITREMKLSIKSSEQLALWGNDLEDMLVGNIKGEIDSWAVFWALSVIKQGGLCLNPYYSLINNIGFDGTGVHCRNIEITQAIKMGENKKRFNLPEKLLISEKVKSSFPALFRGVYHNNGNLQKFKAIVYGMGNFYKKNECKISNQYNVVMYIDKRKTGYYAGRKIGKITDIKSMQFDVIILMITNMNEAMRVVRDLNFKYNIPLEKICLGQEIYN